MLRHLSPLFLKKLSLSNLQSSLERLNKLKIWLTEASSISFNFLFESSASLRSFLRISAKVELANRSILANLEIINKKIYNVFLTDAAIYLLVSESYS